MLTKGKWLRIECDVEVTDRYHDNCTIDLTTTIDGTLLDMLKQARRAGWVRVDEKWHCPECAAKLVNL